MNFKWNEIRAYLQHCNRHIIEPTFEDVAKVKVEFLADCERYEWMDTPVAWRSYLTSLDPGRGNYEAA